MVSYGYPMVFNGVSSIIQKSHKPIIFDVCLRMEKNKQYRNYLVLS